jgi:ABC-type methionine transport system ATPase subunit
MVDAALMMSVLREVRLNGLRAKLRQVDGEIGRRIHMIKELPEHELNEIEGLADLKEVLESDISGIESDQQSVLDRPSILLLDEIETHLHPAWQRRVLPAMQRLFPKAQIFIATHSPFVISSLNHGWIHRLRFDEAGNVKAYTPRKAALGDTYEDVLEDIMEMPERFDPDSEEMLKTFEVARDAALAGDVSALPKARELAVEIAKRGPALEDIVGRELRQLERLMQTKQ